MKNSLSRRDAVKVATGGAVAAGLLAMTGSEASGGIPSTIGSGKIDGIKLPSDLGAQLGGTPEEAAKVFLKAASKGLAVVMQQAVLDAVGQAVGSGPVPDWTKLITGCQCGLAWDSPPGTALQTVTAIAGTSDDVREALGGIGFSIGISGTF